MEEAAHMDPKVFKTVVVPLFGVVNTAVLAISSPDDDQNYYSELLNLQTKEGDSFFHVIRIGLACMSCIDAGKAVECKHKLNTLPPWKTAELQARVEAILANDEGLINRETKGIVVSDSVYQYHKEFINKFKKRVPYQFENDPLVLHTAIDPSGGGQSSDYAIVTIGLEHGQAAIVSLNTIGGANSDVITLMLYRHFVNLFAIRKYEKAKHYVYFEAVANWELVDARCKILATYFSDQLTLVRRDPTGNGRYGVYTGRPEKVMYNECLKIRLAEGSLHWGVPFTTIVPPNAQSKDTELKIKERLYKELANFQLIVKESDNPAFTPDKESLSGKSGNGARKDDCVLAVSICLLNAYKTIGQTNYETGNAK